LRCFHCSRSLFFSYRQNPACWCCPGVWNKAMRQGPSACPATVARGSSAPALAPAAQGEGGTQQSAWSEQLKGRSSTKQSAWSKQLRGRSSPAQTMERAHGRQGKRGGEEGQQPGSPGARPTCFAISTHSSSFFRGTVLLQCAVSASTACGMSASCMRGAGVRVRVRAAVRGERVHSQRDVSLLHARC